MKKFVLGISVGVVLPFVGGAIVLLSGLFDMAATKPPFAMEQFVGQLAVNRSLALRAPDSSAPKATKSNLQSGLVHYRENCLKCHGGPDLKPDELAKGLNPPAPELDQPKTQDRKDGELFWLISEGIRMTGMPGFSPTHTEEEIWDVVVFLRHLKHLTDEERSALSQKQQSHQHHH